MCLLTGMLKPAKADKDIYVIKVLWKDSEDTYHTPHTRTTVKFTDGKATMTPDRDAPKPSETSKTEFEGGFIHAYPVNKRGFTIPENGLLAYIPAGTEYYLDDDGKTVCATKLVVTKDYADSDEGKQKLMSDENYVNTYAPVIKSFEVSGNVGKYRVGSSFVSPEDLGEQKPDAFVVADGLAIALEDISGAWCERPSDQTEKINRYGGWNEAVESTVSGKEMTENVWNSESYKENPDNFPIFKKVKEMGNGWCVMSPKELYGLFFRRLTLYHAAIQMTGVGEPLEGWYLASAENSQFDAWGCRTHGAGVYSNGYKWSSSYVRPSLALAAA